MNNRNNNYYSDPRKYKNKIFRNLKRSLAHIKWCAYITNCINKDSLLDIMNPLAVGTLFKLQLLKSHSYKIAPNNDYSDGILKTLSNLGLISAIPKGCTDSLFDHTIIYKVQLTKVGYKFIVENFPNGQNIHGGQAFTDIIHRLKNKYTGRNSTILKDLEGTIVNYKEYMSDKKEKLGNIENEVEMRLGDANFSEDRAMNIILHRLHISARVYAIYAIYCMGFINRCYMKLIHTKDLSDPNVTHIMNRAQAKNKIINNELFHGSKSLTKGKLLNFLLDHQVWRSLKRDKCGYTYHKLTHDMFRPQFY